MADTIILSVKLSSGEFDSTLKVPADLKPEDMKEKMDAWFSMIRFALDNHVTDMEAVFPKKTKP